jgi:hypothetical protein
MIFKETESQLGGRAERTFVREHARQRWGEGIFEKHQPSRWGRLRGLRRGTS